jgi:drug/metabolite transporter (DMT)-like permease
MKGYALVAFAASMWGTWSLFLRRVTIDPRWITPIVFAAMTFGGAPLLAPAAARGHAAPTRVDRLRMLVLGVSDGANAWLFFNAMSRSTNAIAVLSHYLAPTLVSIIAPRWLGTRPQRGAIVRALVATSGLLLVLQPWQLSGLEPRHMIGAAFGAASAVFYAINVCVSKQLATTYTPEETLVYHSAISLLVVLPSAPFAAAVAPSLVAVGIVTLAGLLVGVTAGIAFVAGVRTVPAEHASLITFLEPITAVIIGVAVFRERMNLVSLLGGALVIGIGVAEVRAK